MPALPTTTAVLLAAGGARRMGTCKALLPIGGRPLLDLHLDALEAIGAEICVVTGRWHAALEAAIAERAAPPSLLHNPDWETTGMRESLLLALRDLPDDRRVICVPCDSLPAPVAALRALQNTVGPAVLSHGGAPGHPIAAEAQALRAALAAGTLRALLPHATALPQPDASCLANLNRPEDWAQWSNGLTVRW